MKRVKKFQFGNVLPEITVTAINVSKLKNRGAKDFARALNRQRLSLMKRYNLSNQAYADLSKFAMNIGNKESGLGGGISYNIRKRLPDNLIQFGKRLFRGKPGAISRGYTQIKYASDINNPQLKREYDELGVTEDNLSEDPNSMANATIARAVFNRNYLNSKKGVKNYHWSDGKLIPEDLAMAMYWNRGKLTDYANPNPSDPETSGASGYARRFTHQKVIQ